MNFFRWGINKVIESKYYAALQAIVRMILKQTKGIKSAEGINSALESVWASKDFQATAQLVAYRFVSHANSEDFKTWRQAAKASNAGREMYETLEKGVMQSAVGSAIKDKVKENANLITNMPLDLSQKVTEFVRAEALKGRRAEDIASELQSKLGQYSAHKINTIARTEASKATTALTEARAKDVGVNWYVWRTANDGNRVRDSHQIMQRVLCRWVDPPAPEELAGEKSAGRYNAGEIYNCRCYPEPVITINQIKWPAKVYHNGRIQTMTKSQFEKLN